MAKRHLLAPDATISCRITAERQLAIPQQGVTSTVTTGVRLWRVTMPSGCTSAALGVPAAYDVETWVPPLGQRQADRPVSGATAPSPGCSQAQVTKDEPRRCACPTMAVQASCHRRTSEPHRLFRCRWRLPIDRNLFSIEPFHQINAILSDTLNGSVATQRVSRLARCIGGYDRGGSRTHICPEACTTSCTASCTQGRQTTSDSPQSADACSGAG
jgi:hypothetical protein